jgi:hypothetical protein
MSRRGPSKAKEGVPSAEERQRRGKAAPRANRALTAVIDSSHRPMHFGTNLAGLNTRHERMIFKRANWRAQRQQVE